MTSTQSSLDKIGFSIQHCDVSYYSYYTVVIDDGCIIRWSYSANIYIFIAFYGRTSIWKNSSCQSKADREGECLMFILGQTDQTKLGKVYFSEPSPWLQLWFVMMDLYSYIIYTIYILKQEKFYLFFIYLYIDIYFTLQANFLKGKNFFLKHLKFLRSYII